MQNRSPKRTDPTLLPVTLDRAFVYGAICALVASIPFIVLPWFHEAAYHGDLAVYWSAGANAGSQALTDVAQLFAWQRAHGLSPQPFLYLPAFAWLYAPLRHLSPIAALVIAELAMTAVFILAALIAARTYRLNSWFCIAAVLAWGPAVNSIEVGQNIGLALTLVFATCWALLARREVLAGVAAGLLLYKPSVALPILLLLLIRAQWRALIVSFLCAGAWYFAGVAASGGDWLWPATYGHTMAWWLPLDFKTGSARAFTIPTLLMTRGVSFTAASVVGLTILLAALPLARRAPAVEAASMMPLVGLTASVHAWPYEAALALPALLYSMATFRDPWRTRLICIIYPAMALALITRYGTFALATLCVTGTALWFIRGYTAPAVSGNPACVV